MTRRASLAVATSLAAGLVAGSASAGINKPEPGNVKGKARSYLYVQNARHGTFTAVRGRPGRYRLRLRDVDPHVLFFTDRPARDTGLLSQKALLGSLFAKGRSVPNAAVEIVGGAKNQDVLAVKLSNPRSDERKRTLSYDASLLRTISAPGLRHYRGRLDRKLPGSFGAVSLFIDSGTAWGNSCQENVVNDTGQNLVWQSEDKWSTDTWQYDPANVGIPPDGNNYDVGYTSGGFSRGCHNSTTWTLDDGTSVNFDTTDPYSGSNTFSCTTSNPSKYQCTLGSSSVIHGPILYLDWTLSKT
jgi:hypothetical protein